MRKLTTEEFIIKAILTHGEKYGYWMVVYINNRTEILIWCKKCKRYFKQTPKDHLQCCGCIDCFGYKKLTTEECIKKAILIHGDKYGYWKVDVKNSKKVVLWCHTCKKYFEITLYSHLHGGGCETCGYI